MQFFDIDNDIALGKKKISKTLFKSYMKDFKNHYDIEKISKSKNISMLSIETLTALRLFAIASPGPIIEIGSYIGGSTSAITSGLAFRESVGQKSPKAYTIECGGKYLEHDTIPSANIHRDWKKNVKKYGYLDKTNLLKGFSNTPSVLKEIRENFEDSTLGMFFLDADGLVVRDIFYYRQFWKPGTLLVFDDYMMDDPVKGRETTTVVDYLEASDFIERFDFLPWSTWFGVYKGGLDDTVMSELKGLTDTPIY